MPENRTLKQLKQFPIATKEYEVQGQGPVRVKSDLNTPSPTHSDSNKPEPYLFSPGTGPRKRRTAFFSPERGGQESLEPTERVKLRLIEAAAANNQKVVKKILTEHPNLVSYQNKYLFTPLMVAIQDPSSLIKETHTLSFVKFLVEEKQMNINVRNSKGMSALLFAVNTGKLAIARYLLEQGAEVSANDFLLIDQRAKDARSESFQQRFTKARDLLTEYRPKVYEDYLSSNGSDSESEKVFHPDLVLAPNPYNM